MDTPLDEARLKLAVNAFWAARDDGKLSPSAVRAAILAYLSGPERAAEQILAALTHLRESLTLAEDGMLFSDPTAAELIDATIAAAQVQP